MQPHPLLRAGGPAWEVARAFLLLALLAAKLSPAVDAGVPPAPWLAAVGAAGLVLPAAFLLFSIDPGRNAAFLPLLIAGKVFEAGTLFLLFVTGALGGGRSAPLQFGPPGPHQVPDVPLLSVALVLDVLFLVALVRLRARSSTEE